MPTSACNSPGEAEGGTGRPPPPEKGQGGHEKGAQPQNRPPTPQETAGPPSQTAPRTEPPEGAQDNHPAKTGNTKPGAAAQPKKDTPNTPTHTSLGQREKKNKNIRRRSPNERGRGDGDHKTQDRDSQRGTPQSHDTTCRGPSPQKRQKSERRGGGANPTQDTTRTPPRHRRPPRKDGVQTGHTHQHAHTPTTKPRGAEHSQNQSQARKPTQHT